MTVIDSAKYAKAADFFRGAVQNLFDSPCDWTPNAEAIIVWLRKKGLTDAEERKLRPYFSLFVAEAKSGIISGFLPQVILEGLAEDPPLFSIPQLMAGPEHRSDLAQADLFAPKPEVPDEHERALIEQLIAATKLYDNSDAIKALFAFTVMFREFAPFNAMLLHIQKPGLTHAATAHDWWNRFNRAPKKGARPLLVLRMMGPVDFVFDVLDTEGQGLPTDAFAFPTFGTLTDSRFTEFMRAVSKEKIDLLQLDAGDGIAGCIRLLSWAKTRKGKNIYQIAYNKNHPAPTRFVTVAHELAHLYLGHLGPDNGRRVPDRQNAPHELQEVEAEMVAYLVAVRNGLKPRSESYLTNYKGALEAFDLYAVMRATNAVETAMGISAQKLWNEKGKKN